MRTKTGTVLAVAIALLAIVSIGAEKAKPTASKERSGRNAAAVAAANARQVKVFVFNDQGKLVGPVASPKWNLSRAEWRKLLTPEQFAVLRASDTEPAFCGNLLDNKKSGVYTCAGCGLPLFSSKSKFDSGTGWPSFMQPVARQNLGATPDFSDGTPRLAIHCARCEGHLGHVFGDGPAPTGERYCLNSAAISFTAADQLASLSDPAAQKDAAPSNEQTSAAAEQTPIAVNQEAVETETAVLAGGCFWCMELTFEQLKGVLDVESGYCGGSEATATYAQVHEGLTRHAEAIQVTYDPNVISYAKLLDVFFDAHDPTQRNRQGPEDVGPQYRSEIFYADAGQKEAAEAKIRQLRKDKVYRRPIVTRIEALTTFFPAEAFHQDFARRNPTDPYIQSHAYPKARDVESKHPELIEQPK